MANLNKVMLIGNLTRDPDCRHTPRGTHVADITLAINRVWTNEQNQKQEETIFVDVTLWGRQADLAKQYLNKGRGVYIEGRLQMDSWDDKETGKKRSKLKVIGENLQFLPDGRGGNSNSGSQGNYQNRQASAPQSYSQAPQSYTPPAPQGASPATSFHEDYSNESDEIPF